WSSPGSFASTRRPGRRSPSSSGARRAGRSCGSSTGGCPTRPRSPGIATAGRAASTRWRVSSEASDEALPPPGVPPLAPGLLRPSRANAAPVRDGARRGPRARPSSTRSRLPRHSSVISGTYSSTLLKLPLTTSGVTTSHIREVVMSVRRLVLLVLGLVSLLVSCARRPPPPAGPAPVAVRTAPVVREKVLRPIRAAGRLGGKQEMALAFRSSGTVDHLLVREGQTIRKGQVLATLDTLDADAALVQANAAYVKAERDRARIEHLASQGAV